MLDVRYAGRISLFLHTSATDAGLPSDRSGVAYPDTQTVRAVCVPPIDGNLMVLLSHECNHVIANNTLGSAGTSFMNEGTATAVIGERYHAQGRHFLYPWTAARIGQLPSISTLVDDSHWNDGPQDVAYNTSASFIAWLIDTRGPASFKQIFTARSSELDGRVRSAYGAPLTQLETEWQIFVTGWRGAGV